MKAAKARELKEWSVTFSWSSYHEGDVMDSQGSRYPIMKMNDNYFPVDVGRTFIGFLGTFYEMLRSKAMTSDANLLEHYIPRG